MRLLYDSWQEYLKKSDKPENDPIVMPWLFSKDFRRDHRDKAAEIRSRFAGNYLSKKSKAFERQLKANVSHDVRGRMKHLDIPTLIVVGKGDELTPPRMAEDLKAEMPGAKLVILDRGGHGLYWEVSEMFNKTVLEFLKEHSH